MELEWFYPRHVHRPARVDGRLFDHELALHLAAVSAQDRKVERHAEHMGLAGGQVPAEAGDVRLSKGRGDDRHHSATDQILRPPAQKSGQRTADGNDSIGVIGGDDPTMRIGDD